MHAQKRKRSLKAFFDQKNKNKNIKIKYSENNNVKRMSFSKMHACTGKRKIKKKKEKVNWGEYATLQILCSEISFLREKVFTKRKCFVMPKFSNNFRVMVIARAGLCASS